VTTGRDRRFSSAVTERFAELPEHISLDLAEVAILLGALDQAAELVDRDTEVHRAILRATRLITRKVWPELGGLLDEDGG
jgi:hypothetical protein